MSLPPPPHTPPGVWTALLGDARLVTADRSEIGRFAVEQGSRLRAEHGLMVLGGLIVLLSSASLTLWLIRRRPAVSIGRLFRHLARDEGLTRRDRALLRRLGRTGTAVERPGGALALLLCPGTLGDRARRFVRRPGPAGRRSRVRTLRHAAAVRRHLFGPAAG